MSHSLNSLKMDYIGEYYRGYLGDTLTMTIIQILQPQTLNPHIAHDY